MTRSIPPGPLDAAMTARVRRGAECVVIEARDGTRAGFTTWDRPVTLDLGLGAGAETCQPGINLSAVTLAAGLDASSFECDGVATGVFSRSRVLGGRWRRARVWLVRVSPGIAGFVPIMAGRVGESRVEGRRFILEVRNVADEWNQSFGRVLSPYCSAEFGNSATGCPVVRVPVACTVTAVESDFRFAVDRPGEFADGHFALGAALFTSGALDGVEGDVFAFEGTSAAVELHEPLPEPPLVGDTLQLLRGCSRLLRSDDPALPTCLGYGAVADFRGWPEVPSSRVYLRATAPGSTYE